MTQNPTKLFIRGGQLFLHNVRMFTQVGKKVALALIIAQIILTSSFFMLNTSAYQRYLGFVFVKAELTLLIDYKAKLAVKMPTGESYSIFCERVIKASMITKNGSDSMQLMV